MAGPVSELVPLVVVGERAAYLRHGMPCAGDASDVLAEAARLQEGTHPRWAVPSAAASLRELVDAGVTLTRTWDLAEAHRLLHGGWAAGLGLIHAIEHGLALDGLPQDREADLFDLAAAPLTDEWPDDPVGPDGYLRADAFTPAWADGTRQVAAPSQAVHAPRNRSSGPTCSSSHR